MTVTNRLSKRETGLILIFVLLVVIMGYVNYLRKPVLIRLENLEKELAYKRTRLQLGQKLEPELKRIEEEYRRIKTRRPYRSPEGLLGHLEPLITETGLSLKHFRPVSGEDRQKVEVVLVGDYTAFREFCQRLVDLEYRVYFSSLRLRPKDKRLEAKLELALKKG